MADILSFDLNYLDELHIKHYLSDNETTYSAHKFPPHLHDEVELYILMEGDASFMVEHSLYNLKPGDVIVTKPNEMHNCILNTTSVHKHLCFWFSPPNEFLFDVFLNRPFGERNLISLPKKQKEKLLSVCMELHNAALQKDDFQQYYFAIRLIYLLRDTPTSNQNVNKSIPQTLQTILDDININFANIKSLNYFTEKYFISESTLQRMFKKHLHTTAKVYIETKRLAHSRLLLKQGVNVFDACMQAGFPDYSNYIRLFRKRFGTTPKHYQENK